MKTNSPPVKEKESQGSLPVSAGSVAEPPENTLDEVRSLAREMAHARQHMVEFYDRQERKSFSAAIEHIRETNTEEWREQVKDLAPEQVSWYGLDSLADGGEEEVALAIWNNIKRAAMEELRSGFRAAQTIDQYAQPLERARFIALRESFRKEWQPSGATELVLIDQLAQIQMQYEHWLRTHVHRISVEGLRDPEIKGRESWQWVPPRQSEADATREAFEMTEKWQRMFLRTLRALRDLRRYTPSVVIQNAGQVNVGQQQVNVAS